MDLKLKENVEQSYPLNAD